MRQNNFNNFSGSRRPSFGPGNLPPFIKAMIIVNVAVFVIQFFISGLSRQLGLVPALFFSDFPNLLYQPFTYMFLHGGFGHIFFNMFALWMFGTEIEHTWGSKSFSRFYFIAGLAGAILTLIVHTNQNVPTIGASAAIYGVLTAYWMMFPNRMLYIYFVFPVKVKWAVPGMMLLGFLFSGANIAHMAHLGGILFALLYLKADLRFGVLSSKLKSMKFKKQQKKFEKNRQNAEDMMKKVDSILDKINRDGIEKLTKAERKILEEASSELSKKDK